MESYDRLTTLKLAADLTYSSEKRILDLLCSLVHLNEVKWARAISKVEPELITENFLDDLAINGSPEMFDALAGDRIAEVDIDGLSIITSARRPRMAVHLFRKYPHLVQEGLRYTPLHYFFELGWNDIVKELIQAGANPNILNKDGLKYSEVKRVR